MYTSAAQHWSANSDLHARNLCWRKYFKAVQKNIYLYLYIFEYKLLPKRTMICICVRVWYFAIGFCQWAELIKQMHKLVFELSKDLFRDQQPNWPACSLGFLQYASTTYFRLLLYIIYEPNINKEFSLIFKRLLYYLMINSCWARLLQVRST